jgi:CheY-like chemotaxis protein
MASLDNMLAGMRILAVDDLVESRSAMKKMLVILGAGNVDVAMDGDEAAEFILNNDYDLVISDYNLGRGRDGQQILEEARFTHRLKATSTFVMLTGENAMDMVMGAIEYEPDDYVTKPFTIDVMRQRLTRILSVKGLIRPINESIDLQTKTKTIQLCDEFIKQYPRLELRVKRIKSRTLINMKSYNDALKLFDSILNEREINWAMLGKATCLFHLKKYNDAKKLVEYTIEQHPNYVQCYDLLSKINIKQKDLIAAQNALVRAIQVSPKQVLRQMELGRIAFANLDFEVAEGAFKQSVKLARHSCYRSVKNYLLFAKSLQHKITPKNNRDTRISSVEAFKALDEAKTLYKHNPEYIYDATIIESTTFSNLGKEIDAKAVANKAEAMLAKLTQPTCAHQLALARAFIDTKQHAKAQDLLAIINARKDLSRSEQRDLEHTRNEINEHVVRTYTTEINDKAIEFFEQGQLARAIELFDKATAYKEAGLTVLLNAIQAKITFMDQSEATLEMVSEVGEHLDKVGSLPEIDERHGRWLILIKSYERIKRSV